MGTGRPRPSLAATGDHRTAGHKPAPASVAGAFARRAARSAGATRAQPGCTHALAHVAPACTDYASHASSACLPCGAGARLGAGVGEAQRAGQSAGAYPANRVRSLSRCGCRRVQEVERESDLRVARARPEVDHCAPGCSRQRAHRRAGSSVGAACTHVPPSPTPLPHYRVIANLRTGFLGSICPPNHTKEIHLT